MYQERNASLLIMFITFSCFPYNDLFSQTTDDTLSLEAVEIAATRQQELSVQIPASLSVINQNEIAGLKPTFSLEESLRAVPGVFVCNRYNESLGQRISIRGLGSRAQFGVRNITVLLDGIPLTFADGTAQLNNLDLGLVNRVEILRGPSATLYGNSAGGVIYLTSRQPDSVQLKLTPRITAGSFGRTKLQLGLSGKRKKTSYFLGGSFLESLGYREFSEAKIFNFNAVTNYSMGERSKLILILNLNYSPYLYNPSSLSKSAMEEDPQQARDAIKQQVSGKTVQQGQAGIHYHHEFGDFGKLNITLFGISRRILNPIFGRIIEVDRMAGGLHTVYHKNFQLSQSSLNWMVGFDVEFQYDDRKEYENPGLTDSVLEELPIADRIRVLPFGSLSMEQDEEVLSTGAFTVLKWNWKRLIISAGLRGDWYRFSVKNILNPVTSREEPAEFDQWSPSVGILYRLDKGFHTYLNYSTAFQTPTANEFSNDPHGTGFNENLKPEDIQSVEWGVQKNGVKVKGGLVAFYFTVDDQLIPYQSSGNSDVIYYRNAGRTSNRGAEFWLRYSPGRMWSFDVSYTYMQHIFDDYEVEINTGTVQLAGNEVPGVPSSQLFAGINFEHPRGFLAELDWQWTAAYYANDFNGPAPGASGQDIDFINESYMLLDIRLGYIAAMGPDIKVRIYGGINNIFNEQYSSSIVPNAFGGRFFEPAPGRNYYVGVSIPIIAVAPGS